MKNFMFAIVAFAAACFAATPSHAQLTGPSLISQMRADLSQHKNYKVEAHDNTVSLRDAATGAEVLTVSQVDAQQVTITGVVAKLNKLSAARKHDIQQRIDYFNFSSAVGTLDMDNKTGQVTMEHHLNPRYVSASSIVNVAMRFSDVVRAESEVLAQ
jgi:hypothetical protein